LKHYEPFNTGQILDKKFQRRYRENVVKNFLLKHSVREYRSLHLKTKPLDFKRGDIETKMQLEFVLPMDGFLANIRSEPEQVRKSLNIYFRHGLKHRPLKEVEFTDFPLKH